MGIMDKYAIYQNHHDNERHLGKNSPLHHFGMSADKLHSLPEINHKVKMFERNNGIQRAINDKSKGQLKQPSNYFGFGLPKDKSKGSGAGLALGIGAGALGAAGLGALALKRHLDRKDEEGKKASLDFGSRYAV